MEKEVATVSYRSFDVATMAGVSSPWVDPLRDRPLLLAIPMVAPLMPAMDVAHQDIVSIGSISVGLDHELKVLSEEAEMWDGTHDQKMRGVHNVLTEWAMLVSAPVVRATLLDIRDRLCREGRAGTRRTFLAEAGNVDIVEQNVDDEMRATLSTITCGGITLADEMNNWFEAGHRLGRIEQHRAQLTTKMKANTTPAGEISRIRLAWADVVHAILTNLDIAGDSVDEDTRIRILQPLLTAEKKWDQARRRAAASDNEDQDTPADADTPPADSDSDTPPAELDAPLETEDQLRENDSHTGTEE